MSTRAGGTYRHSIVSGLLCDYFRGTIVGIFCERSHGKFFSPHTLACYVPFKYCDSLMDVFLCCLTCEKRSHRSSHVDVQVRVWNASSGACLAVAGGHMAAVGAVAFSKKKKNFIVSGSRCRTPITLLIVFIIFSMNRTLKLV
jgi:WD40 repeat protein